MHLAVVRYSTTPVCLLDTSCVMQDVIAMLLIMELVRVQSARTVGVMALVDAGKTTTTERLLYYAGLVK